MKLKFWATDKGKSHWVPHNEVEFEVQLHALVGLKIGTFQFRVDPLSHCATLPK